VATTVVPAVACSNASSVIISTSAPIPKHNALFGNRLSSRGTIKQPNICFCDRTIAVHTGREVPTTVKVPLFDIRQNAQHPTRSMKSLGATGLTNHVESLIPFTGIADRHESWRTRYDSARRNPVVRCV